MKFIYSFILIIGVFFNSILEIDFSEIFVGEAHAQSFERNCNFRWRVRFPAKQDIVNNGRISVKSNSSCKTNHIGRVGGNWQYHSVKITKQPANGRLSKVGNFGIRFVPNNGFKGKDTADISVSLRNVETGKVHPTIVRTKISVK